MGDYIALHGFVPQNELPVHLRNKIPENEIWIRENVYADHERRKSILAHEYAELDLMITHGITYKEAHEQAEFIEHLYYPFRAKYRLIIFSGHSEDFSREKMRFRICRYTKNYIIFEQLTDRTY